MVEIILVVTAGVVLIVAQILLARSYKKEKNNAHDYKNGYNSIEDQYFTDQKKIMKEYEEYRKSKRAKKPIYHDSPNSRLFDTKYEEIMFLYKTGAINEDEYKKQVKNIIN